ncbi:MAG: hypothetical protein IJW18_09770 [Lachnospiraceae bacterium]|nr:hypothetical protein [Lachnospiraceae bacterium]
MLNDTPFLAGRSGGPYEETTTKPESENSVPDEEMSNDEYSALLSKLNEDIYAQSVLLSNLGKYINSWWKSFESVGGTFTTEKAMASAYEWLEKNSDYTEADITKNHSDIQATYKKFIQTDNNDRLLLDVAERLKQQYTNYTEYFSLVTTPGGDRNSFVADYNKYTQNISSSYETIGGLLE